MAMFPRSPIGRVIVGVCGSPGSLHALRQGVALARAFECTLVPVLAWEPPGGDVHAHQVQSPELDREWTALAQKRLCSAFEEGLGGLPGDIYCEPRIVRGPTGQVLVAVADQPDDLLVIGAGRRGLIHRVLHARIAEHCVAHAVCQVLAVPPPPLAGTPSRLGHLTV